MSPTLRKGKIQVWTASINIVKKKEDDNWSVVANLFRLWAEVWAAMELFHITIGFLGNSVGVVLYIMSGWMKQ